MGEPFDKKTALGWGVFNTSPPYFDENANFMSKKKADFDEHANFMSKKRQISMNMRILCQKKTDVDENVTCMYIFP